MTGIIPRLRRAARAWKRLAKGGFAGVIERAGAAACVFLRAGRLCKQAFLPFVFGAAKAFPARSDDGTVSSVVGLRGQRA